MEGMTLLAASVWRRFSVSAARLFFERNAISEQGAQRQERLSCTVVGILFGTIFQARIDDAFSYSQQRPSLFTLRRCRGRRTRL